MVYQGTNGQDSQLDFVPSLNLLAFLCHVQEALFKATMGFHFSMVCKFFLGYRAPPSCTLVVQPPGPTKNRIAYLNPRSYIKSVVEYCEKAGNERLLKILAFNQSYIVHSCYLQFAYIQEIHT